MGITYKGYLGGSLLGLGFRVYISTRGPLGLKV